MEYNSYSNTYSEDGLRKHMIKTHMWMALGVLVTFGVAFFVSTSNWVYPLMFSFEGYMPFILLFAQLGVCIALSARLMKMKVTTTKVLFMTYSALTGLTFSVLLVAYSFDLVIMAFMIAAIFYGSLVAIGLTTRADLSKIGTICYAGLFAMVIYSLLSMLLGWPTDSFVYSIIGLVIFMGITAWDSQKAKQLYMATASDEEMSAKMGIYSAFQLYLDFINIFLYILRILGSRD